MMLRLRRIRRVDVRVNVDGNKVLGKPRAKPDGVVGFDLRLAPSPTP
jgi:hypothetical protein